jgi:hypothetical protein
MSDYLQPGLHPDPDSLNAFIEGVLPEHERLQCLAHLAECPICREVVYLAEEPLASEPSPVPVPMEKIAFWKRWLTPIPALSAAVFAGTLVLSFWLYQHLKSVPNTPELVAIAPHIAEPASAPETVNQQLKESLPAPKIKPRVQMSLAPSKPGKAVQQPEAPSASTITPAETAPVTAAPPAFSNAAAAAPPAPLQSALLDAVSSNAASVTQTGIAGRITDPAGAAIPGAAVKLRPIAGTADRNSTSDPKGQFNVAGLEPGRYELQVAAPGFRQTTKQVDIQPNQMARADSTLSIGSVSESVVVTAETAQVRTSGSAKDQSAVQPLATRKPIQAQPAGIMVPTTGIALPSKLPVGTTVVSGKLMIKTDSASALFLSQNAGKKWKAVKPVWHGKVVSLVALSADASSSDPAFQLTTDGGAVWLSRDGSHWYAAPAQK